MTFAQTSTSDPFGTAQILERRTADPAGAASILASRRSALAQAQGAVDTVTDPAIKGVLQGVLWRLGDELKQVAGTAGLA